MLKIVRKIKKNIFDCHDPIPNDMELFSNDLNKISQIHIDDYQRSYYQYMLREKYGDCKSKYFRKFVYYTIGHLFYFYLIVKSKRKLNVEEQTVVYYKISNNRDIIPPEFKTAFVVNMGKNFYFDYNAKIIFKKIKKLSLGDWTYLFEVLYSLSNYAYILNKHKPKRIITTYESSCSSSVLTLLCNMSNVEHIDFMHGEKLYSHLNTLAHFNKIYVWDEYYIDLYNRLQFKYDDIIVLNPWINKEKSDLSIEKDICFYLNYETQNSLNEFSKIINKLTLRGINVMIRPHPSQYEDIIKMNIIDRKLIENPFSVSIFDSINQTEKIVSRFSTVLYQAYSMNKEVVIDDVTNTEQYSQLKDAGYIMIQKKHMLLSEIL